VKRAQEKTGAAYIENAHFEPTAPSALEKLAQALPSCWTLSGDLMK
jgi:hypothetical protein